MTWALNDGFRTMACTANESAVNSADRSRVYAWGAIELSFRPCRDVGGNMN